MFFRIIFKRGNSLRECRIGLQPCYRGHSGGFEFFRQMKEVMVILCWCYGDHESPPTKRNWVVRRLLCTVIGGAGGG